MEERLRFVHDVLAQRLDMTELCERCGVSRKTGYKWVKRYETDGRRGLADRSRAPRDCPHRTEAHIAALLVAFRREHPLWGARKLLRVLRGRHPDIRTWPAPSTWPSC
jgi:transposase